MSYGLEGCWRLYGSVDDNAVWVSPVGSFEECIVLRGEEI